MSLCVGDRPVCRSSSYKTKNIQQLHKLHNQNHPMLQYSSMHGYVTYKVKKKVYIYKKGTSRTMNITTLCGNQVSSDGGHFSKFRLILWLQAAWPEVDSRLP
jgi:hypothetical protein